MVTGDRRGTLSQYAPEYVPSAFLPRFIFAHRILLSSRRTPAVPIEVGMSVALKNPALPANIVRIPLDDGDNKPVQHTVGIGPERVYPAVQRTTTSHGYPPRPPAGSAADLDRIFTKCDDDQGNVRIICCCIQLL